MAEMIGDADHSVGGDPAGNADNQAVQIQAFQLGVGCIGSFVSGIVDDQAAVHNAVNLCLQSFQSLVMLHLQTLDGGVDLTETYITNDVLLHINSP